MWKGKNDNWYDINSNWSDITDTWSVYPSSLAMMWDKSRWARSYVGTDLGWSYAGEQYVDGVSVGLNPPITDNGLGCSPPRTNIFTIDGTSPEISTLTAQDYCLQVFGSGSVTCSYGTATVGVPLQFTATAGSVTFTGTDIVDARWQLTADGGYVYPETPIGTSVTSSVGTAAGNGAYFEMDEATLEAFGGEADGVELFDLVGGAYTSVAGGTADTTNNQLVVTAPGYVYQTVPCVAGERYRIYVDLLGSSGDALNTISVWNSDWSTLGLQVTDFPFTVTPTGSSFKLGFNNVSPNDGDTSSYGNISVQKLLPASLTLATVAKLIGSSEISIGETFNIISTTDTETTPLYYGRDATGSYIASFDGINTAILYVEWDRDDTLLPVVRTADSGVNFKVGLLNATLGETSVTYGTPSTFSGSFGTTTDYFRFGLNTDTPMEDGHVQVHNSEDVTDETVLQWVAEYGWL